MYNKQKNGEVFSLPRPMDTQDVYRSEQEVGNKQLSTSVHPSPDYVPITSPKAAYKYFNKVYEMPDGGFRGGVVEIPKGGWRHE